MRNFLVLQLIATGICLQLSSCSYPASPMVTLKGPNDEVAIVFFYKKGISYEEKQLFESNILHTTSSKGYDLREGVSGEFFVRNSDYEGYAIEFYPDATQEQHEKLRKSIESSPVIYKVYENIVPNKIKLE